MQNSCQTTIMKKALATSREKYSELLQVHEKVFAHNEQLLLRNKELEDVVRKQEADKSAFVENMAILVQRNEQAEEEIQIMAKALEMKGDDDARVNYDKQKYEELEFQYQESHVTIQNLEEQLLKYQKLPPKVNASSQTDLNMVTEQEAREKQTLLLQIISEYESEMKDLTASLEEKQSIIMKYAMYVEQQIDKIDGQTQAVEQPVTYIKRTQPQVVDPQQEPYTRPKFYADVYEEQRNRNLALLQEIKKLQPSSRTNFN